MGQTISKEDHLFGHTISTLNLNEYSSQEKSELDQNNEIRVKDITMNKQKKMLDLSEKNICSLTPNISLLTRIKKLDLSNNHLNELPEAIGYLCQLEQFSVAHNNLSYLPDSLCHLSRLKDFELSHNRLISITPHIGHLSRLQSLYLNHNQLTNLPFALEGLSSLVLLDLSHNPISVLPAQIIQLPYLRRFRLDGCPLATDIDHFSLSHDPPSLLEICARSIISLKKEKTNHSLPDTLSQYLTSYSICHHCRGPYFDSFISRARWVERNETWIPLEYRLCSAHWSDESDRIFATFSLGFSNDDVKPFFDQESTKKWRRKMQDTSKNRS
ncbi:hypothetical protein G6F56_007078 [Rhizopus delemar]|nr:hypothetical protein G6F56_007078 [Rhizopus delemar]